MQMGLTRESRRWTVFDELRFSMATLSPFELLVLEWFQRLDSERPASEGGVRPIPWSKREERLSLIGLDGHPLADDVQYLWDAMDSKTIAFWARRLRRMLDKNKDEGKASEGPTPREWYLPDDSDLERLVNG